MTVAEALALGADLPGRSPDLDAELLLAKATGRDRTWVLAHQTDSLPGDVEAKYRSLLKARRFNQPVAYLLGTKEFYGRPFTVTPAVLVPRPETELLVEEALKVIQPGDSVLDIGTGSGCIAITIALECPEATVVATDISPDALAVAQKNAADLQATVTFQQADLLPPVVPDHPILVANLPYVPDAAAAASEIAAEPPLALRGGPDGLDVIRKLLAQLQERAIEPKRLVLEIDPSQQAALAKLWPEIEFKPDLTGRTRLAIL